MTLSGLRIVPGSYTLQTVTLEPDEGSTSYLHAFYDALDVDAIEVIGCPDDILLIVDEEGLPRNAEQNELLSRVMRELVPNLYTAPGIGIVGAGIFVSMNKAGNFISLSPKQQSIITEIVDRVMA